MTVSIAIGTRVRVARSNEIGVVREFVEPRAGWKRALVGWTLDGEPQGDQFVDVDKLEVVTVEPKPKREKRSATPPAAPPAPRPHVQLALDMPRPENPKPGDRHYDARGVVEFRWGRCGGWGWYYVTGEAVNLDELEQPCDLPGCLREHGHDVPHMPRLWTIRFGRFSEPSPYARYRSYKVTARRAA